MKYQIACFYILLCIFSKLCAQTKQQIKQPNIVWIVCEDISPHLGSYGEKIAKTPVLDKLASEAVRYTQAYTTAGVCAPSRCALITGCYQTAIGGHNMRTLFLASDTENYPKGLQPYSAVIPVGVKCFSEYLREAGYYCTNNAKQDYQFEAPVTAWDESSVKAHWRNRPDSSQPFFSVFNFEVTHESQVWKRDKEPLLVNPKEVEVPSYYPDDSISRNVLARFLTNVMLMDKQIDRIIQQLKEDKLYDNSIIFFFSDHGDGLPFAKRELYQRGLKVPLLIKAPFLQKGIVDSQLVSFVDLAPTMLSLAGVPIPNTMQGQAFLGNQKSKKARKYIYAARDRVDSEYDRVRAVSDGRFKYLYNYMPEKPYYQHILFRLQNPLMLHLLELKNKGQLNEVQMNWFRTSKPKEELFDTQNDPNEFVNLATNPAFKTKLYELRKKHEQWLTKYGDLGSINEFDLIRKWWKGKSEAPTTALPEIKEAGNYWSITCKTAGASIGYRYDSAQSWQVYKSPIKKMGGKKLQVSAQRIGFKPAILVK